MLFYYINRIFFHWTTKNCKRTLLIMLISFQKTQQTYQQDSIWENLAILLFQPCLHAAMWQATYEPYCAPGEGHDESNVKKITSPTVTSRPLSTYLETTIERSFNYFNSTSILDLHKHDVPMALVEAGCRLLLLLGSLTSQFSKYLQCVFLFAPLICMFEEKQDWRVKTLQSLDTPNS